MLTQNPALFDAAANALFIGTMNEGAPASYVPPCVTVQTTTRRTETYPVIGDGPAMREIGAGDPFTFSPMSEATITETVKKYGAAVSVTQDDWDDDQLGGFAASIMAMGDEAINLPNALIVQALINGDVAGNTGYDGDVIFSATHPARKGEPQWSNLLTSVGNTTANMITNLNAGIEQFLGYRRENGRRKYTSVRWVTVMAPLALREPLITAVNAAFINSGDSNVTLQGMRWTLIFDPDLDADNTGDFYMINSGARVRGIGMLQRSPFQLVAKPDDDFDTEARKYKVRSRLKVGYRDPHAMIKFQ